ncbi:hypothetical protein ACHAW6_004248 [Cyclotella cf. meneghiniana]
MQQIQFTLIVDDFEFKYECKEDAKHLLKVLKEHYKVKADWTGTRYIGVQLHWDYAQCQVHLYMPSYVTKALMQFHHVLKKKQKQPFPHMPVTYGTKQQFAKEDSTAPLVSEQDKNSFNRSAEIPIPQTSCGQHSSHSNQRNSIAISTANNQNN